MNNKSIIGWREWVELPELGIKRIKAKIDTGARTSVLDVADCELVKVDDQMVARFILYYGSRKKPREKRCQARLVEHREVTNSGGYVEDRVVISTPIRIGNILKEVEITLTSRTGMKFRMLLGRTTLRDDFIIDLSRSYLAKLV